MSAMGQMVLDVQEFIIDMLNEGMTISEVENAVAKEYGEMFRGEVTSFLQEAC